LTFETLKQELGVFTSIGVFYVQAFVIDSVIAQVEDRDLGEDQVLATRSGIGGL
jgi:hypothetical protein